MSGPSSQAWSYLRHDEMDIYKDLGIVEGDDPEYSALAEDSLFFHETPNFWYRMKTPSSHKRFSQASNEDKVRENLQ